jgi:hypothetical protein
MSEPRVVWTLQWVNSQRRVFEWTSCSINEVERIKQYLMREYGSLAEAFVITEGRPQAPIITHASARLGELI